MNRLRSFLFATIVVISSATVALGGVMQFPGKSGIIQGPSKSDPTPTPTPTASAVTTASTSDGLTQPIEHIQVVVPDATAMLMELLLTIF